MKYLVVLLGVIYLSSTTCEARSRHHHGYKQHKRATHSVHRGRTNRPSVRCATDVPIVAFDPTEDNFLTQKEEVRYEEVNWSTEMAKAQSPFDRLTPVVTHVVPKHENKTKKQYVMSTKAVLGGIGFSFLLVTACVFTLMPTKRDRV